MKINAIIFDLDGTLLNTLDDLRDSLNFALSQYGFNGRSLEEVRSFVGNGIGRLVARAIPDGEKNPLFASCMEAMHHHYSGNMHNKSKPYQGILPMLETLYQNGYRLAIASNKPDFAVKELCEIFFQPYVRVAVGESEKMGRKPAPDSTLFAVKQLNSTPDQTLYVGDSDVDLMTAHNAGLPFVGVSWGFKGREVLETLCADGDCIIDTPAELLHILGL